MTSVRKSGPGRSDRLPPADSRGPADLALARGDVGTSTFFEEPIDARRYLEILWRSRILLAVLIVGSTLTAYGLSLLVQASYESTARVLVDNSADPLAPSDAESAMRQLATAQRLAMTSDVLTEAARQIPGETEKSLEEKVTVSADSEANLLDVTASDHYPARAAAIANAVATTFIADQRASVGEDLARAQAILRSRLETLRSLSHTVLERRALTEELSSLELRAATADLRFRLVERAGPPDEPSSPHPFRNALAAFFASTVIGILLVLGRTQLASGFTDARELSRFVDVPIFARVSLWPNRNGSSAGRAVALESAAFSSFRGRAERILDPGKKHVVLVTSPVAGDGTAEVSAALARALAETDRPTLLVLADADRTDNRDSLADESPSSADISDGAKSTRRTSPARPSRSSPAIEDEPVESQVNSNLFVDTGARSLRDPTGKLRNEQVRAFAAAAKRKYTYVVIDAPSLLATNDTLILVGATDEILVVTELDRATRSLMLDARDVLREMRRPVLGLVLIERETHRPARKRWRPWLRLRAEEAGGPESHPGSGNGVAWWIATGSDSGSRSPALSHDEAHSGDPA